MRGKLVKSLATGATVIGTLAMMAPGVSAGYDAADTTADGLCCFGTIFIYICGGLVWLLAFGFSLWMLVDALQRDEKVLPGKVKWALLIFLVQPIGAILYFFMRKKQMDANK